MAIRSFVYFRVARSGMKHSSILGRKRKKFQLVSRRKEEKFGKSAYWVGLRKSSVD
jgi:hypothetical protein